MYRSAPKINIVIRLRDLFCYKMNKELPEREGIHVHCIRHLAPLSVQESVFTQTL